VVRPYAPCVGTGQTGPSSLLSVFPCPAAAAPRGRFVAETRHSWQVASPPCAGLEASNPFQFSYLRVLHSRVRGSKNADCTHVEPHPYVFHIYANSTVPQPQEEDGAGPRLPLLPARPLLRLRLDLRLEPRVHLQPEKNPRPFGLRLVIRLVSATASITLNRRYLEYTRLRAR